MRPFDDSFSMTPGERRAAIAKILAAGILRLHTRAAAGRGFSEGLPAGEVETGQSATQGGVLEGATAGESIAGLLSVTLTFESAAAAAEALNVAATIQSQFAEGLSFINGVELDASTGLQSRPRPLAPGRRRFLPVAQGLTAIRPPGPNASGSPEIAKGVR